MSFDLSFRGGFPSLEHRSKRPGDHRARHGIRIIVYDASQRTASPASALDVEVALLRNNPGFLSFLKQLSREEASISMEDLRKELAL